MEAPPHATRLAVLSSTIRAISYDQHTATLDIEFHRGGIYRYASVPLAVYERFVLASSKGSFFDEHIKYAGYNYRKIAAS